MINFNCTGFTFSRPRNRVSVNLKFKSVFSGLLAPLTCLLFVTAMHAGVGAGRIKQRLNALDIRATTAPAVGSSGVDVAILKSTDKLNAAYGEKVTFKLQVYNTGVNDAHNVIVEDPVPFGAIFASANPSATYNSITGMWNCGTIEAGDTVCFLLAVTVNGNTAVSSQAEVFSMTETDEDSTPNNGILTEDDWASAVTHIPLFYCTKKDISVSVLAPPGCLSYQWFKDGLPISTDSLYTITDFGSYHYEAVCNLNYDTVALCCPIEVKQKCITLGDAVWHDSNNNGKREVVETGLPNVELVLYNTGSNGIDPTDVPVDTVYSSADGSFSFGGISPGKYNIKITGSGIPVGFVSSTGDGILDYDGSGPFEPGQNGSNPDEDCGTQQGPIVVSALLDLAYDVQPINDDADPNTNKNLDFGFYKPIIPVSRLNGLAFLDCNRDGLSIGDAPVPGITVSLYKGAIHSTQVTDVNGAYNFDDLTPGSYRLVFSRPGSLKFTTANAGSNDAIDSDADTLSGSTMVFLLGEDELQRYDAGYQDITAPEFISVADAPDITVECNAVPQQAVLAATDNYDSNVQVVFDETRNIGNCPDNYVITRTWLALDDCGNASRHIQRITVRDTKAPVFGAFPQISDLTVECDNVPQPVTGFTAIDDCDNSVEIAFREERVDGFCADNYLLVRTWIATDNCSNASSKIQVIKVHDRTAPVFHTMLSDLMVSCENVPPVPQPWVTDNCDKDVLVSYNEQIQPGNCTDSYDIIRTWVASDNCGNTAGMVQHIYVRDTQAPVFSNVPPVVTINCGQNTNQIPAVSDNCDKTVTVTLYETQATGDCATGRTITRILTATDNCGNSSQLTQTVYVIDTEAPKIVNTPSNITVNCGSVPPPAKITVTDNCPDAVMIMFDEQKTTGDFCSGFMIIRTWTAMDACGNQSVFTQKITVEGDNKAPVISGVPADAEYDCTDVAPYPAMVVASDDCDNNPKLTFVENKLGFGCGYKLIRAWTATDKCGNVSTKIQIILVKDKTAPLISGVPADITVECSDALPTKANPVAVDACDNGAVLTYSQTAHGDVNSCVYQVLRTWTATDKCGNVSVKTQVITVKDSKGPVITPLNPALAGVSNGDTLTVECDQVILMDESDVAVSDNCDAMPTVIFDEYDVKKGNCPVDGYLYVLNCRWTASDKCGNTSVYEFTLKVIDTKAPIISNVPASITINCEQVMPPLVNPTFSDNCDKNVQFVYGESTTGGKCINNLVITRTWTATDHCGNASTATQSLTIQDNTPPVISNVPQAVTVSCGQTPDGDIRPTVTDNCDKSPLLTFQDVVSANGGCLGSIVRTWTATDACGNSSTASQVILIIDTEAPVIDVNTTSLVLECGQPVPNTPVSVMDNCDANPVLGFRETRFGDDCDFKIIREWTATDKCGNQSTKVKTITVHDKTAPLISGVPADYTASCTDPLTPQPVTVTDVCDSNPQIFRKDTIIGDPSACQYLVVRTWTASDKCGNSTSKTVNITVKDVTAPIITPKNPMLAGLPNGGVLTVECDEVQLMDENDVIVTDDCDKNPSVTFDEYGLRKGNCPVDGYLYLLNCRWTATDKCGNSSVYEFTLKVIDTKAPVFSNVPESVTIDCAESLPAVGSPSVSDNCDKDVQVVYAQTTTNGNCAGYFVVSRYWTATDHCGNIRTAVQKITIEDRKPPVISNVLQSLTVNCGQTPPDTIRPLVIDNCDVNPSLSYNDSLSVGGGCAGSVLRTWTATDACGNVTSAVQSILFIDTEAPVINVNATSLVLDCGQPIPDTPASVSDNCDPKPDLIFRESRFGDDCNFKIVREWIATDKCGNETIKVKTITVHDTTPPVISGIPADFTTSCSDPLTPTDVTVSDICDNNPQISMQDYVVGDPNTCQYQVIRTWTATDKCGNSSTRSMTITVKDLAGPIIVPKSPMLAGVPSGGTITIECDQLQVMTENDVFVTDDCDKKPLVRFEEYGAKVGDCMKDGYVLTITCRWTATDKCGNTSVYVFTVIAKDTKAPVIIGVPDNITLDCKDALPSVPVVTATDNCTKDVKLTFSESTYTAGGCVLPGSVVRTWTATDDCGNSAVKTQLIIFSDMQKPVFIGVNADITLNPGETEPTFSGKAIDNCDTDVSLTVSQTKTEIGCVEVTQYTYTATDDCGNVATAIYNVTRVKSTNLQAAVNIVTSNELCGAKNGVAKLNPVNYTYTWSDGFVGAERNNLAAGLYQVTMSDQCASKLVSVTVGSECPCVLPEIVSTVVVPAGCGGTPVGSIEFAMKNGSVDDYMYVWTTTNGNKNKANGLSADNYSVTISRKSDPLCKAQFNFTVGSKQLVNVFDDSILNVEITDCPNGKALVCTGIKPSDLSTGAITVTDNGTSIGSIFQGCKFDTAYYYALTLSPGAGTYVLKNWSVNAQVFTGEFNTIADLLALMNGFDPKGNWKINLNGQIFGGQGSFVYGKIEFALKNNPVISETANPDQKITTIAMGIALSPGVHQLVATSSEGCSDSLKVTVTCKPLPPVCSSFINATTMSVIGPCGVSSRLCISELPFADISDYSILDNGAAYNGNISSCGNGTGFILAKGIHQLIFTNKNGCKDTVVVTVTCTTSKYVIETIEVNQKDTVCLDLNELLGRVADLENIWPSQSGNHARFDIIPGSSCISCYGIIAGGTDLAAFVITDEQGVRDTTFFEITVIDKNAKGPDAIEDRSKMKQGDVMVLDVLANDKLGTAPLTEIRIVEQPRNAYVFINPENKVVFTPATDFCDDTKDESFMYRICTKEGCDEAPVQVKVQCSGIKVYTGFSPNGDGVNDTFVIEGASDQTNNKLSIYNRYGNQVYYKEGYRNDWNGTWDGKNLPDGTYYYLYDDGKGETKAGYIQILR